MKSIDWVRLFFYSPIGAFQFFILMQPLISVLALIAAGVGLGYWISK